MVIYDANTGAVADKVQLSTNKTIQKGSIPQLLKKPLMAVAGDLAGLN